MKYKIGDRVIPFQDTKSVGLETIINTTGTVISLNGLGPTDSRLSIAMDDDTTRDLRHPWYIHPDDLRQLTKLDKALK